MNHRTTSISFEGNGGNNDEKTTMSAKCQPVSAAADTRRRCSCSCEMTSS